MSLWAKREMDPIVLSPIAGPEIRFSKVRKNLLELTLNVEVIIPKRQ